MTSTAFVSAASVSLRTPLRPSATASRRPVVAMTSARNHAARLAAVPATLVSALPALAEGTGEGLGIDTPLLYIPLILIPVTFFVLFLQFGSSQENEDFTGSYDERRN